MRYVGVETLSTIHCCTKNRILKGLQLYNLEGRSKVVGNDTVRQAMHHFLLVICSNNVSILHRFWDYTQCTWLPVTFKSPSCYTLWFIELWQYRWPLLTFNVIHLLHAFESVICCTTVHELKLQLTWCVKPKKYPSKQFGARSRACLETKPLTQFIQNFLRVIGIPNITTYANFGGVAASRGPSVIAGLLVNYNSTRRPPPCWIG